MAVKKIVTIDNLDTGDFQLDTASKKIKVIHKNTSSGTISNLAFNNGTKKITWTDGGVAKEYSMAEFLADIHVTSSTLSAGTLTLHSEGGPDVTVDLGELSKVTTSNTGNVKFTGSGTADSPLVGNVDIPTYTASDGVKLDGTVIKADRAGLFDTTLQDAFGTTVAFASSTNA